jgi:hypothetical protein
MAASADQPHAVLLADDHHAIPIVFDLVNPLGSDGHLVCFGGERKRIQNCVAYITLHSVACYYQFL